MEKSIIFIYNQSTGSTVNVMWLVICKFFHARSQCSTSKSFLFFMNLCNGEDDLLSIIVASLRKMTQYLVFFCRIKHANYYFTPCDFT